MGPFTAESKPIPDPGGATYPSESKTTTTQLKVGVVWRIVAFCVNDRRGVDCEKKAESWMADVDGLSADCAHLIVPPSTHRYRASKVVLSIFLFIIILCDNTTI